MAQSGPDSTVVTLTVVLIAHGTVSSLDDLPAFVAEIRRGRPAPAELLQELRHRYERVGGSPLLELTRELAEALEKRAQVPTRVAMRLWHPRIEAVISDLKPDDQVCLIPLAPFSVEVYEAAARKALADMLSPPSLFCVRPYGDDLVPAWAEDILRADDAPGRETRAVILTAHSLPQFVIDQGDGYADAFARAAAGVERALGRPCRLAYQSQGAQDGAWLGPTLGETFLQVAKEGWKEVLVAPIGFMAEHIETLYDLDIEARDQAEALGLVFSRVKTLGVHPLLVEALVGLIREAKEGIETAPGVD